MSIRSFIRDSRGNVAILFGLAAIPVIGMVGVALDYNRATNVHQKLQHALDATSLALAREVGSLRKAEYASRAMELFEANFPEYGDYDISEVRVVPGDGMLDLSAVGNVPTTIAGVLGIDEVKISTSSQAVWGSGRIELALVLDNTDSMARSNKMRELKRATTSLLNTLEESVYEEDAVRVSIIPFNTQVKIGTDYEDAEWLLMPESDDEGGGGWSGAGWGWGGGWGNGGWGNPGGGNDFDWDGCVEDRSQPYDASDAGYDEDRPDETGYPAVECEDDDLAEIMPLTDDFNALRRHAGSMEPAGYTNITIGMAWGMASLSPEAPLTQADPSGDEELRRVMVVMTDGDNTRNRWHRNGWQIDPRTREACRKAKEADILVYTVRVIDGNADLLRECASSPDLYYDVRNVAQLLPAFEGIASSISQLRIAR